MTASPRTEWTWEVQESFDPVYTATATPDGIAYSVFMGGPSGGPGGAGYQSYEQLLANGPLNDMPEAIAREVREHAVRMSAGADRAHLQWLLAVEPPGLPATEELAYVSAEINGTSSIIRVLEQDNVVLFDGSLLSGDARLGLTVGFGRPWRRPGARTVDHELVVALAAGSTTTVSCIVLPDFTIVRR